MLSVALAQPTAPAAQPAKGEQQPAAEAETAPTEAKAPEEAAAKGRQSSRGGDRGPAAARVEPLNWRRGVIDTIVILAGTFLAMRALGFAVGKILSAPRGDMSPGSQRVRTLAGILISTGRYVIFLVALLMVLAAFEINIMPILAGVGFVGLAVGFGAQNAVRDIISGFFIFFEDSFSIGDEVRISDVEGRVEEMGLRSTRVRSYEGALHIIPNGSIAMVSNLTRGYARAVVDVALPNTVSFEEASRVLGEVAAQSEQEIQGILEKPQILGVEKLSLAEMTIRVSARAAPAEREAVARELRRRIKEALQRAGMGA